MKALYARQSLDKKDSLSIETQIEQCKMKLQDNEPFKTYEDKGYSGKNTERPSLNQLLNDIENNQIDGVIVYRLDRFSRNIIDFYNLYEIMKKHNCEFISVSECFDTSTPMGRATMGILITFAQMERESIQERVKDNYYYRIGQDGRWAGGPAPYGFTNARTEDGKPTLVINENEIAAVKLMYKLYSDEVNISLGKVANILSEKGYSSRRTNGSWDSSAVSKILQNTIYVKADEILYKYLEIRQIKFLNDKEYWDGSNSCHIVGKRIGNSNIRKYTDFKEQSVYLTNFPGIIDSRTYIHVMNRLGQNEQITSSNKPSVLEELSGKLKCSCGYAIKSYSRSTNGRPYLDCYGNRSLHKCSHKYNKFDFYDIQEEVGKQIQIQINNLKNILQDKRKAKAKKQQEIGELKRQLNNLILLASKSELVEQAVVSQIENIQKKINSLQLELQINSDVMDSLQIPSFGNNKILDMSEVSKIDYFRLDLDRKKYIVNLFIDKIVLNEDKEEIEIFWKI